MLVLFDVELSPAEIFIYMVILVAFSANLPQFDEDPAYACIHELHDFFWFDSQSTIRIR